MTFIEGDEITAFCDIRQGAINGAQKILKIRVYQKLRNLLATTLNLKIFETVALLICLCCHSLGIARSFWFGGNGRRQPYRN